MLFGVVNRKSEVLNNGENVKLVLSESFIIPIVVMLTSKHEFRIF